MRIPPILIARHLCDLLPSQVRTRVLADHGFVSQYGHILKTIITIGGSLSIDQVELFSAARGVLAGKGNQSLKDILGRQFLVTSDEDTVSLKRAGKQDQELTVALPDLIVLSPSRDHRTRALKRMIDSFGPAAPDFSALQVTAESRELTDDEVAELFSERSEGFEAYRTQLAIAHESDRIRVDDIVPHFVRYYETFCGPDPHGVPPEKYLTGVLPTYRQQLLKRNLARGLEICLLGALRDDLMPGAWTSNISDDEMWSALEAIEARTNPFVALGMLDIALARQHNNRYKALADELVAMLGQDQLPRPDGVDGYEILPLFAQLTLDHINVLEDGALRAPFWKRLCAWMQAGLILQTLSQIPIKIEELRGWIQVNRDMAGTYAQMIDLHREPMYLAGQFSQPSLRGEVISRLLILRARHEAAGHSVPRSEDIDAAITRLSGQGSPLGWAMPGPLEGHQLPAEQHTRQLSEAHVVAVLEELSKDPYGAIWSKLAYFSQSLDLGHMVLSHVCEISAKESFNKEMSDKDKQDSRLLELSVVAAAHRSKELARNIAGITLRRAPHATTSDEVLSILHTLIVASAAFESEAEWSFWIREQFERFAHSLPAGEATKTLREHLSEIRRTVPISSPITSRAEAIAAAAN
jgi:hypothetical protein